MRSRARDRDSRILAALRTTLAVVVGLAGLGLTWRSEGDLGTLASVAIALAALLVLPRPERWRGFLTGVSLFVVATAGLSLLAAAIIVNTALLGFDGTSLTTETFEAPR
jgi:hypothetical protein